MPKFLGPITYIDSVGGTHILDSSREHAIEAVFEVAANTTITLQNLIGAASIDWGDGTANHSLTHEYALAGTYTCFIYGVTDIGQQAFYDCVPLVDLAIPDSVKSIGQEAFYGCSNLKRIALTIPTTFTQGSLYIDEYAFALSEESETNTTLTSIVLRTPLPAGVLPVAGLQPRIFANREGAVVYNSASDHDNWGVVLDNFAVCDDCYSIDFSKYEIIKTSNPDVRGSDGVIVLLVEAAS